MLRLRRTKRFCREGDRHLRSSLSAAEFICCAVILGVRSCQDVPKNRESEIGNPESGIRNLLRSSSAFLAVAALWRGVYLLRSNLGCSFISGCSKNLESEILNPKLGIRNLESGTQNKGSLPAGDRPTDKLLPKKGKEKAGLSS
jgi:hypothetical protein